MAQRVVCVKMSEELFERLDDYASWVGASRSQVLRDALIYYLERMGDPKPRVMEAEARI